eukprot:TRINITY_DN296_c1_g1_i1.p1 TRINITY_DN296_c1_g1~~TRINITY_DN296_c1_g1_i1.p1  ORF type:complete len:343 (+),score=86.92 TRINITY_DN296_c1_g1_i1:363-1391(+)
MIISGGFNGNEKMNDICILKNAINVDNFDYEPDENNTPNWMIAKIDNLDNGISGAQSEIIYINNEPHLLILGGYDNARTLQPMIRVINYNDVRENDSESKYAYNVSSDVLYEGCLERRWFQSFQVNNHLFIHGGFDYNGPINSMYKISVDEIVNLYNNGNNNDNNNNIQLNTKKNQKKKKIKTNFVLVNQKGCVPSPRRWHTVTPNSFNENQCFLFGGYDGSICNDGLFEFNYETETWKSMNVKGNDIPVGRCRHTFTQISEKEILMIGGYDTDRKTSKPPLLDVYKLTLDDYQWHKIENWNIIDVCKKSGHSTTLIDDHKLLIFGGSKHSTLLSVLDTRNI